MIPILWAEEKGFEERFARLVARSGGKEDAEDPERISSSVRAILDEVRTRGDAAVLEYTRRFDGPPGPRGDADGSGGSATARDLEIGPGEIDRAIAALDPGVHAALERAANRIRAFHSLQMSQVASAVLDDASGIRAELLVRPLERAGVYVPGGTAAYPSTVLMNVIPAKEAGVKQIVMVSPAKNGVMPPAVLAAARIAGVDRLFSIGGAQAIGALAFGTETVPRVDKIVGPGNAYVQEAKRQVYGRVAIDEIAGPSEVLILADETASPEVVAADLLAQAEHDVRSAAVLITWSDALAEQTQQELAVQCRELPRAHYAETAIRDRGGIIVARDRRQAFELANRYAPEHLGLAMKDAELHLGEVLAAGAVFIGHHAPEALGDYNAGVNHVLPTSGTARFGSPLSVHDFVRRMSVLKVEPRALEQIGLDAAKLARIEGLEGHARAIEVRLGRTGSFKSS
jgi:histidinol dehydrogenase